MKAVEAKNEIYELAAKLEELPDSIDARYAVWGGDVGTNEDLQDLDGALDTLQDLIDALRFEIQHALNA